MAPPTNDPFANSDTLVGDSGSVSGTTFDATKEGTESTTLFGGTSAQSVWWDFTPSTTGWYKFYIDDADITYHGVFGFDDHSLVIELFPDGVLTAMTSSTRITFNSATGSNSYNIAIVAFLTGGTNYFVRVASSKASSINNSQTCDFVLQWDAVSPPANDNLANVVSLGSIPVTETGITTFDATMETGEVFASTSGGTGLNKEQSVWYTFTPATSGKYSFEYTDIQLLGNAYTTLNVQISTQSTLAGYTPANELTRHAISLFNAPIASYITYVDLVGGTTYYIRVSTAYATAGASGGGAYNGSAASFDLAIDTISPPTNDDFANATVLSTTLPGTLTAQSNFDATQEAAEPDSGFPFADEEQTIWYSFTPTTTGKYEFRVPHSSLVYTGVGSSPYEGFTEFILVEITSLSELATATLIGGWKWIQLVGSSDDAVIVGDLVSGHTYYLRVSTDGTPFNVDIQQFDLHWDLIPVPANDNFANATSLTGASGSQSFTTTAGSTVEASEPNPYYWYSSPNTGGTVWFDWLCPATGDYVFVVGTTDTTSAQVLYELAVWTGSAVNALTKVTRNWAGTESELTSDRAIKTGVGFHGISGTHYKIQVTCSDYAHGASEIVWRTNTIVGDTTALAGPIAGGRTDNYGHTDAEPPPNFVTLLSGHDYWWYTDGQAGQVRWFKQEYTSSGTVYLQAQQWNGHRTSGNSWAIPDAGMIVYKGADYASLTVAQSAGENVAMMLTNLEWLDSEYRFATFANVEMTRQTYPIDVSPGDTLWIAMFGLYDADYVGADGFDAPQFDVDINFVSPSPANDNVIGLTSAHLGHDFFLDRSEWGSYWAYAQAGMREGSTAGATAEVGEPSDVAGFTPTRSVWYEFAILQVSEDYKFWVESSVDCVMSIYRGPFNPTDFLNFIHIASDDDSGPGDQPEITATLSDAWTYWIKVDSRTEGDFTLKFQRQVGGTPPANDDFANAEVISSIPFSASGTTVDASAEPAEREAQALGIGPTDSVWYKYVATFDGQALVSGECTSQNEDWYIVLDVWKGTSLDTLVRANEPPAYTKGWFAWGDTPSEIAEKAITVNFVSGETYYFRVQTETGGSEDFIIYVDNELVYLNLQALSQEGGPQGDTGTVYLPLVISGTEDFHQVAAEDSATVSLKITPGVTWETHGHEYVETAIVLLDLQVLGGECFSRFHFTGEGEADPRWEVSDVTTGWSGYAEARWTVVIDVQPGCH